MRKKIIALFVFVLFIVGLCLLYDRANNGFSIKKIRTVLPQNSVNTLDPNVVSILDQPFFYLGRGGQTFAFESQDKKYVLKLLRYDRITPSCLMKIKKHLWGDYDCFVKELNNRLFKLKTTIDSYQIAKTTLSEFTQVLYTHLEKTSCLNKKVQIFDKLGREYWLDLDTTGFVLQKKMELIKDFFFRETDPVKIKGMLTQYLTVIKKRSDRGVWVKDHNHFLLNYGIIDGKLYEIDVGSYRKDLKIDDQMINKNNLDHVESSRKYIKSKMPEYASFFEMKINEILKGAKI